MNNICRSTVGETLHSKCKYLKVVNRCVNTDGYFTLVFLYNFDFPSCNF